MKLPVNYCLKTSAKLVIISVIGGFGAIYTEDALELLQILEVDPWTRTPISANIGTFEVPLLTYVLIETHTQGVPHTI